MRPRKLAAVLVVLNGVRLARMVLLAGVAIGLHAWARPRPMNPPGLAADTTPMPVLTADPPPYPYTLPAAIPLLEPRTVDGLLEGVKMYGEIGWGQRSFADHTSLVRTTDGGATWTNVGPRITTEEACGFTSRSAVDAWILTCQHEDDVHDIVSGTHDGGATWSHDELATDMVDVGSIDFEDASHGTLVLWPRSYAEGMANVPSVLFRSSDGGRTWSEISRPGGGTITFSDPAHAFVRGDEEGHDGTLRFSADGGKTFAVHPLLRTCNVNVDPIFSGSIGVVVGGCPAGWFAFRTTDHGVTWKAGARIDLEAPVITFVDPDHGVDSTGTLVTSNGGASWTNGDPTLGSGVGLSGTGRVFAVVDSSDRSSQIVAADAGKDWRAVLTVPRYGSVDFVFSTPTDMLVIVRGAEGSLVYRSKDAGKSFEVMDRR